MHNKKPNKNSMTTRPNHFFRLEEINLEISFALEAGGETGIKLYVVKAGGKMSATQTHKVTLKLVPIGKGKDLDGVVYFQEGINVEVPRP